MNHASLFSGIGGFDLAAEWTGWNNVFNCEWEEFPRKVLKHHFPNAKQYEDIKDFNATEYRGRIDVLSGGFPCQPFSTAGLRKGTEDSRHLWPEMLRVIGECQPRWVVGENVRGLVSWSNGLVLETCYSDLENLGYSVQSFIIPACAAGNAPHRRDRVWIVAYSNNTRRSDGHEQVQDTNGEVRQRDDRSEFSNTDSRNAPDTERIRLEHTEKPRSLEEREGETRLDVAEPIETNGKRGNATDTDSTGTRQDHRQGESGQLNQKSQRNDWENFPTVPLFVEEMMGFPKNWTALPFQSGEENQSKHTETP